MSASKLIKKPFSIDCDKFVTWYVLFNKLRKQFFRKLFSLRAGKLVLNLVGKIMEGTKRSVSYLLEKVTEL